MDQLKFVAHLPTHRRLVPVTGIRVLRLRQDEHQQLAAPPDNLQNIATGKSYLSHHNIDSFPRIAKIKIIRLIPVLLIQVGQRPV